MKGKSTADCVTDYVNQYGIDVIAIKKFHVSRSSKTLRMIADELENLAANRKIVFYEYSIDDLKEKLLFEPRGNKHLLMEEISKRYSFLLSDLQRESVHKNPYLVRMFEAVALGSVCFNAIDIGKKVGKLKT
jgi:predicted HTH domain antitoxin